MTTTTQIDLQAEGKYQPLAAYSMKYAQGPSGSQMQDDKAANSAARRMIENMLAAAGFRWSESHEAWYSKTQCAVIQTDAPCDILDTTIGVTILDGIPRGVEYVNHQIDGTYDSLPLVEKFRLSSPLTHETITDWLMKFDRAGKTRPGDLVK